MTSMSYVLIGNFAWTAFFVAFYLSQTIWGQFQAGPVTWQASKPMRLAWSMALFVAGCVLFIVAAILAPKISVISSSTYLVWSGWGIMWLAEIIALSAIGRVAPAFCVCVLWTVSMLVAKLGVGG